MSIVCQYCLSMLRGLNCIAGRCIALHSILCCTGSALYLLCIIAFQCSASHCIRLCQHCVACKALYCIVSYESAQDPKKNKACRRYSTLVCQDDFAWQVRHFVWPGITFSWQGQYFRQVEWKIAKRMGTTPSALHSTFRIWRKSPRIALFLMLSNSKIEEVSQNCFLWHCQVQNWGSIAELLRFLTLSS
jgi:hypothetical protein